MMTGKIFVDTNILIYAHNPASNAKSEGAREVLRELWMSGRGVLSTQVLQELCVNLRRRYQPPLALHEVRDLVQNYLAWEVVVNDPHSTLRALEIESRYKISFWDALIIEAAESAGATLLYSEDLSNGQEYCGIRIVNPFAA
jgi:predicted nucleic acid-binding protein